LSLAVYIFKVEPVLKFAIPTALCLPLRFEPDKLAADLATVQESHWQSHFNQAIYEGDWSAVALRAVPGSHLAIYSDPASGQQWADTPILDNCPYFREILSSFDCPLMSVRLMRLAPGAVIKEHRDPALGLDFGEVRLHLVVKTNPNVECRIDGHDWRWAVGECWYADFSKRHSFANRGTTDRVHLVLDCGLNDWLRALLEGDRSSIPHYFSKPGKPAMVNTESLRLMLMEQPELMAELFDMRDSAQFVTALAQAAQNRGLAISESELMARLQQGHREWIERRVQ